ncbi:MAG: hypothetical protein D6793_03060 [Thermoflexia bacterium]|nr:MAG: hypothetical protein D6793_03060 [Thermoflexia bacterium]
MSPRSSEADLNASAAVPAGGDARPGPGAPSVARNGSARPPRPQQGTRASGSENGEARKGSPSLRHNAEILFVLSKPFAPFLNYTTVGLLPARLLEGVRAADLLSLDFNLQPVGSGPFQVAEVETREGDVASILLKPNPEYYGPRPYLEGVRFRFYPSYPSAFRAFQAGEVEGVGRALLSELPQARQEADLNLYSAPLANQVLIFLNLAKKDELPFFQEKEARQVLLYGLDRQGLVEGVLEGQAVVAHSPILAGTWAYYEGIHRYEYDPQKAGALLDGAGWVLPPGGKVRTKGKVGFSFTLLSSTDPVQAAVAQEVARPVAGDRRVRYRRRHSAAGTAGPAGTAGLPGRAGRTGPPRQPRPLPPLASDANRHRAELRRAGPPAHQRGHRDGPHHGGPDPSGRPVPGVSGTLRQRSARHPALPAGLHLRRGPKGFRAFKSAR